MIYYSVNMFTETLKNLNQNDFKEDIECAYVLPPKR